MSFILSAQAAAQKMSESVHVELIFERSDDRDRLEACMVSGWDAWGRTSDCSLSLSEAAARQSMMPPAQYELLYGRVPRLMQEHRDVFGQRRPWMPGGFRGSLPLAELEAMRWQPTADGLAARVDEVRTPG